MKKNKNLRNISYLYIKVYLSKLFNNVPESFVQTYESSQNYEDPDSRLYCRYAFNILGVDILKESPLNFKSSEQINSEDVKNFSGCFHDSFIEIYNPFSYIESCSIINRLYYRALNYAISNNLDTSELQLLPAAIVDEDYIFGDLEKGNYSKYIETRLLT